MLTKGFVYRNKVNIAIFIFLFFFIIIHVTKPSMFYDDDNSSIKLAIDVNKLLMIFLSNTESTLKDNIKLEIKSSEHYLFANKITFNKVNKFVTTKVLIEFSNLIKAFESFKLR